MKKLARAFIILGIVLRFWMIVPIVFGVITLRKLGSAKDARELLGWGVVTLFFVSQIAGILMLIMTDEDLRGDKNRAKADVPACGAVRAEVPAAYCAQPAVATPVHLAQPIRQQAPASAPQPVRQQPAAHGESGLDGAEAKSMQSELVELFRLKQEGYISAEEYEARRKEILEKYYNAGRS